MATQKELKERYMDIVTTEIWSGSQRMIDYAKKEFCYAVELNNGDLYVIDKPRIKKDFCFGYGWNGVSTGDDADDAYSMARNARENTDYFMRENLEDLDRKIDDLKKTMVEAYKYLAYTGQKEGSKLKSYTVVKMWDNPENDPGRWERLKDVEQLDKSEIKALIDGYEEVKKMFMKRLNTYLKKYGLSKVNSWTYLRD